MTDTVEKGRQAEQLAENFLISKGYTILKKNWRIGKKELDIICEYQAQLIVVEVKSRTRSIYPVPGEVVNLRKQRNIIFAADAYIAKYNVKMTVRFDIISVVFSGFEFRIEHIEDAFFPEVE